MVFQSAEPLASPPGGFPIGTLITKPANQRADLFLAFANRLLEPLTALLLALCSLLLLLLPALQQLLVQKLSAGQQCCRILRRGLLALTLLLQAANHTVHLTITSRSQKLLRLLKNIGVKA